MKLTLSKISFLFIACLLSAPAFAQMIKAPTKTGSSETKKRSTVKPQVHFREEEDGKDSVAKKNDNAFTFLILKANKVSAINVNINDNESGKIRAGMSKKIPLSNSDELRISLNDGQGNQYDTSFIVDEKDAGHNIIIAFPEVDYAAIRAEELRQKNERNTLIRLQKEENARKIREAEEALKKQRTTLLDEAETRLKELIKQALANKAGLQEQIDRVKKGQSSITAEVIKARELFLSDKSALVSSIKVYADSATAYNMKEKQENFLKTTRAEQDKILKDEFYNFIAAAQAGKQPMSSNVEIAFKASRSTDISFFIRKDSLDEAIVAGKRPLDYALEVKSDASIFQYLFDNGIGANNYGGRFTENKDIYATPLAHACMNADTNVIKLFIAKEAQFFPPSMSKLEKKKQVKFLLTKFGDKPDVLSLLKANKYDMDDGTATIASALNFLDSSMVLVEGGSFSMGCTNELTADCASDEKPVINVTVDSFYISKFEVTQKVWAAIMDDENPSFFKDCPNCPVEMVSWKLVNEFIIKLNKLSGKNFRLPTEAEWEYAARGGRSEDKEFTYSGSKDINEVGWCKDNSNKPSPIGAKKSNALGLFDMSGNVSEWCNDFYAADYFSRSTLINPKGPEVSAQKVIRGGSFMQSSWSSRLSNREGHEMEFNNNNTGFRLAMSR